MDLAKRSITSVSWNVASSLTKVVVLFGRSVLLARWLPVDVFGVYTLALSIISVSEILANFGFSAAFLHRSPETEDQESAAANHFTINLITTLLWTAILTAGTLIFARGNLRTALLTLIVARGGLQITATPRLILVRRVVHRRLSIIQILNTFLTTIVALGLAWQEVTLWALLATDLTTLILTVIALYLWRPIWRPRLAWSRRSLAYFLNFGGRNVLADLLLQVLDRLDDLWTGFALGETALGFYSRAYTFATYPRLILATPINSVAGGTYAELKGERKKLSQAFFRTNALIIRTSFFLAGIFALIAPEFIRLFLGKKWLPMLEAFRLMLLFTMLDPIRMTLAHLFVAVGRPGEIVRARVVQLAILVAGLLLLGPRWGITGVALAVNTMLVAGTVILLWQARSHVSFSPVRMFAIPALSLLVGILLARLAINLPGVAGAAWRTGLVKGIVFTLIYGLILLVFERRQLISFGSEIVKTFAMKSKTQMPAVTDLKE